MTTITITAPLGQDLESLFPTAAVPANRDIVESPGNVTGPTLTATQTEELDQGFPTWISSPPAAPPISPYRVTGLDKWEGKVLEVNGDTFAAELYPIDNEGMPITADFALELLGSDAAMAVPGDVFYLSVRTVKARGMRPTRTESLRLRRLGHITPEEVRRVYAKADALLERLEQLFD